MPTFEFQLSDPVRIKVSFETGTVIGRAEHLHAEPAYFVRYRAGNGLAVEAWWSEDALELMNTED